MLKINPQKRISASDALKHYYFDITQWFQYLRLIKLSIYFIETKFII